MSTKAVEALERDGEMAASAARTEPTSPRLGPGAAFSTRMRILHVLDHSVPIHSGYTFRTLAILREQRKRGWETFQITSPKHPQYGGPIEQVAEMQFLRTPPVAAGVLEPIRVSLSLARRLADVAATIRPDVIHAHSPVLNALPALWVGWRLGIRVVYEVRAFWEDAAVDHGTAHEGGLRYRLSRALETFAMRRADAVTTICEGLRHEIAMRGIEPARITVIPNAVDVEKFAGDSAGDAELRRQLGLDGRTVIGFIGSFYGYEGLAMLLQAMPMIASDRPDVRLLLVGGGPQDQALRKLAAELGIADQVIFIGRVPHDQVERYYGAIDVLAYPRLPMRLTEIVTPLKPLEAMARGRLLVASDVGGHRELIRHGETGILFKAGSVDALAREVLDLLKHPERWPALKAKARRFVETDRTWAGSVARYVDVYGLGSRGGRDRAS